MGRILVIEDEPGTQVLLKGRLHDLGHEVVMANTGAMGLMEARAQSFDLFLIDIHLGSGIDGYEVCRRIKVIPGLRNIPVVLLSGRVDTREELHRGYEAGCEAFLMKGDSNLLEDTVRAMLRLKALQDELSLQNQLLEQRNRAAVEREKEEGLEHALRNGDTATVVSELAVTHPEGAMVVDADGIVRSADRGARDLFGRSLEGVQLGRLAPSSGLEAFVRDARTRARGGYDMQVSVGPAGESRTIGVSVVPLAPTQGDLERPLRIVLLQDAHKRRIAAEVLQASEPSLAHRELGPLLESAREHYQVGNLVGHSPFAVGLRARVTHEAASRNAALIWGEEGTGRSTIARTLHHASGAGGNLVVVDLAALASGRPLEELFGHTKDAPGARGSLPGAFQQAHLGTLILCEPQFLDLEAQKALAAAIDQQRVIRVGGEKAEPIDVRVIVVSREDLHALASRGEFSKQLLEIIAPTSIHVPALRDRAGDIVDVARWILLRRQGAGAVSELAEEACWVLEQYDWPGNIRELESCMERALERAPVGLIRGEDLPRPVSDIYQRFEERNRIPATGGVAGAEAGAEFGGPVAPPHPLEDEPVSLELYEKYALQRALRETSGDKLAAARLLRVGKSTLYRKLKRYEIR